MMLRRTRPLLATRNPRTVTFVLAAVCAAPLAACVPRASDADTQRCAYRVPLSDRAWPSVAVAFHLDDTTSTDPVAVASVDESAFAGGE